MEKTGARDKPDVSALASRDNNKIAVLLWHYHDDDIPGPVAEVSLHLEGLPSQARNGTLARYVIDADHGNAYTAWQKMGSPQSISPGQLAELENAGKLAQTGQGENIQINGGQFTLRLSLPRQAVMLIMFDLTPRR
jgi:xylan 1,4-beta-xylosidase